MGRSGSSRVHRGGSWPSSKRAAEVARVFCGEPESHFDYLGFPLIYLGIRLVEVVEDSVPAAGSFRRRRGGCHYYGRSLARHANRGSNLPGENYENLGIRLVEVTDD